MLCSSEEGVNASFIQLSRISPMIISCPPKVYFQPVFCLFLGPFLCLAVETVALRADVAKESWEHEGRSFQSVS